MPLERPPLATLVERVRSDLRGRLGLGGALLRRAMADVLAAVWAGAVHMLHGHLEWLAKQLFPDTADREFLLRQAALYGIYPTPASFASGTVTATGDDDSVVATDSILQRSDGVTYRVTADATITAGEAAVSVIAVTAGSAGNLAAGETLTLESPATGVDASVTVAGAGGISGGVEEETTEGTLDRLMLRLQEPPEGGADHDYEAWAIAVAGVTRAWVYPNELGLGTVVVRFVMDDQEDIFPDAGAVAAVQAALEAQRPISAEVTAEAPTPLEVDFAIAVTPDTVAVHGAVAAELADLFRREAEPGDGAGRGTVLLSQLRTAIGVAEGVTDYDLVTPAADVVPAAGQLVVLGDVDWSP